MSRKKKYADTDLGLIERTMYQHHDHGYCLRPKPCLCDEGRVALARIERVVEAAREVRHWFPESSYQEGVNLDKDAVVDGWRSALQAFEQEAT